MADAGVVKTPERLYVVGPGLPLGCLDIGGLGTKGGRRGETLPSIEETGETADGAGKLDVVKRGLRGDCGLIAGRWWHWQTVADHIVHRAR